MLLFPYREVTAMRRFLWVFAFSLLLIAFPGFSDKPTNQVQPAASRTANPEVEAYLVKAESLVARKQFDDAIDLYKKCIAITPRDATLYNRLGVAYHRKQDFALAKKNYEAAIKLNPQYPEAYNNLGTIAFTQKKYGRAIKFYKKALKIRPDAATTHYNLGSAYFAKEDYQKAFEEYQTAITQDPNLMEHISATGSLVRTAAFNRAKYHFYLAKIYAQLGDHDRAIDYMTRAFEEGFKDTDQVYNDKAFAALLKDEKFVQLMHNPPKPIE